ncbi:DUF6615 family protein [Micromonospora sp. LZ34]
MLDIDGLIRQMDELAELTWERVAFADQGFSFREDSITEHNLFELARRHPQLLVQRFNGTEEAANGADWEWWVGGPGQGWVGLRVQAKKLAIDGTYHEIAHTTARRQRQYDLLIEACLDDEAKFAAPILPLYCFYNGWNVPGGKAPVWPEDTKNAACPNEILPPECSHLLNIRHIGCAITTALDVAAVHQGPHGRRTTLNGHLSRSRPWSHLFHQGRPLAAPTAASSRPATVAAQVLWRASEWFREGYQDASTTGNPNYGRLFETVLRPPARELPPYANALLSGQLPRAAEWPQATFVAVLNVEAAG